MLMRVRLVPRSGITPPIFVLCLWHETFLPSVSGKFFKQRFCRSPYFYFFEPTYAYARLAHMHRFLSICLWQKSLDQKSNLSNSGVAVTRQDQPKTVDIGRWSELTSMSSCLIFSWVIQAKDKLWLVWNKASIYVCHDVCQVGDPNAGLIRFLLSWLAYNRPKILFFLWKQVHWYKRLP